jgi:hypothetical protein
MSAGIPRVFHFVFGLKAQIEPFHLVHFLCLASCRAQHPDATIYMHYRNLPWGPWWDEILPQLTLQKVADTPADWRPERYSNHADGQSAMQQNLSYAHESDFLRLDILLEHGGIYADMDSFFVQPYPDRWFNGAASCLMAEELPVHDAAGVAQPSLCNAVILATPRAEFVRVWRAQIADAFDGSWSNHSCALAAKLWREHAAPIQVLPAQCFFEFPWTIRGMQRLFELDESRAPFMQNVFSIHLWAHLWWSESRIDFTRFHQGLVTAENVLRGGTTYFELAKSLLQTRR